MLFFPIKQPPLEVSPVGSKIPSIVEVSAFWQRDSVLCIFNLTTIQIFLVNLRSCKLFCAYLSFFSQMILQLGFLLHVELNTAIKVWKIRTSEENSSQSTFLGKKILWGIKLKNHLRKIDQVKLRSNFWKIKLVISWRKWIGGDNFFSLRTWLFFWSFQIWYVVTGLFVYTHEVKDSRAEVQCWTSSSYEFRVSHIAEFPCCSPVPSSVSVTMSLWVITRAQQ